MTDDKKPRRTRDDGSGRIMDDLDDPMMAVVGRLLEKAQQPPVATPGAMTTDYRALDDSLTMITTTEPGRTIHTNIGKMAVCMAHNVKIGRYTQATLPTGVTLPLTQPLTVTKNGDVSLILQWGQP